MIHRVATYGDFLASSYKDFILLIIIVLLQSVVFPEHKRHSKIIRNIILVSNIMSAVIWCVIIYKYWNTMNMMGYVNLVQCEISLLIISIIVLLVVLTIEKRNKIIRVGVTTITGITALFCIISMLGKYLLY